MAPLLRDMAPVKVIGALSVRVPVPFLTSPPAPLRPPPEKLTAELPLIVSANPPLLLVPPNARGPVAAFHVWAAPKVTLLAMVWRFGLLLRIATPPLRIVRGETLVENELAALVKARLKMSQVKSVTGVRRVLPSKMTEAEPLFKGGTPATQFCGVLQLSLRPAPFHVELAGGTISPSARRMAPGANPVNRMAPRKSTPGSERKRILSSAPLLPATPVQPLMLSRPPVRVPPAKTRTPRPGGTISPSARRMAPGANPVNRMAPRKS